MLGEFEALLRNESVPEAVPAACGSKVTVKGALCPAAMVTGNVIPVSEKPDPFQLALDTVTFELAAIREPVFVCVLPTGTLPKLNAELLTERLPDVGVFPDEGGALVAPPPHPMPSIDATNSKLIE